MTNFQCVRTTVCTSSHNFFISVPTALQFFMPVHIYSQLQKVTPSNRMFSVYWQGTSFARQKRRWGVGVSLCLAVRGGLPVSASSSLSSVVTRDPESTGDPFPVNISSDPFWKDLPSPLVDNAQLIPPVDNFFHLLIFFFALKPGFFVGISLDDAFRHSFETLPLGGDVFPLSTSKGVQKGRCSLKLPNQHHRNKEQCVEVTLPLKKGGNPKT